MSQGYVSPALTHFVGARLRRNPDKQFELLRKILKGGVLLAFPRVEGTTGTWTAFDINPERRLSDNDVFKVPMVCFCDIPFDKLDLHMKKYGRFGIAFDKDFVAGWGASPVMYVPRLGTPALLPYDRYPRHKVAFQQTAWNQFGDLFNRLEDHLTGLKDFPQLRGTVRDLKRLRDFMETNVFVNIKFFDHLLVDDDPENFYMEREWRVSKDVRFALSDVRRLIIPKRYARRLRSAFPRFDGEVQFAD